MNELIRELMAEAGMSVAYLTNTKQIVLIEKFAELIVRECIDTAHHHGHPDLEFLLKHFGVEE